MAIRCAGCVTMIHARVDPSGASESDRASARPGDGPCEQAQCFGPVVLGSVVRTMVARRDVSAMSKPRRMLRQALIQQAFGA